MYIDELPSNSFPITCTSHLAGLSRTAIAMKIDPMKPANRYHWLLFDADGTLFDYERAEARALKAAFMDFKLPYGPATAEIYRAINHQIWQDFERGLITSTALRTARFERLFESLQVQANATRFSTRYLQHLASSSDLMAGAENVILQLKEHYRLAIITNGLKDVQYPRLEGSAIGAWFEVIAVSEEVGAAKPDPRFFDAAFKRMGQPPRETALIIGDSLSSDIQGGIQYGLDTCWFNPTRRTPDPNLQPTHQIAHLDELLSLLLA
jgi:2-haloacid dehalogenase